MLSAIEWDPSGVLRLIRFRCQSSTKSIELAFCKVHKKKQKKLKLTQQSCKQKKRDLRLS